MKICSVEGCGPASRLVHGWCMKHYKRWNRYGDPHTVLLRKDLTPEERFWPKVDKRGPDDCWLWLGSTARGYGTFRVGSAVEGAHRYSHQLHGGSLTKGMHVDHRCHEPLCVNPNHLRLVTPKQNGENRKGAQRNTVSGTRGVFWHKVRRKWQVTVAGVYVGVFPEYEIHVAGYYARNKRNELYTHNDRDRN